jgi:hypothetical protein
LRRIDGINRLRKARSVDQHAQLLHEDRWPIIAYLGEQTARVSRGKDRRDSAAWQWGRRQGHDPASADVFASNADGTLTVIHQDSADRYHVAQTIETPQFSRNLGLDPTNHRVFVAAAKFGPSAAGGRGRGPLLPNSFSVLVIEK